MPGIQDLLQLAQGGGGGGAPAPGGGAPPQGGGIGAAISQVLGNLMQDPNAMKAMQQYMMQLGGGGGMMAGPGAAQGGPPLGPMQIPPGSMPPGMEAPPGAPQSAEDMVGSAIDQKGATWDGVDAPTQNDIERLQADPSATNIKSFDEQFGQGTAEKYLGQEGGGDQSEESGETAPDKESSEY